MRALTWLGAVSHGPSVRGGRNGPCSASVSGTCDPVTSVMPDRQGRIWWVTGLGGPGDGRWFCR